MKKIGTTLIAVGFSISAFAQSELAGKWNFKDQESISGNLYANGSPVSVSIVLNAGSIDFEKVITVNDKENMTIKETVTLNGKPVESLTTSKKRKTISFERNGSKYTQVTTIYDPGDNKKILYKVIDTWYLENKQLILDRKDENLTNGETWESKATYTKN